MPPRLPWPDADQRILPDGCQPIIVTDAGFRGPWFREVESYGWHWVGRIRNKIKYYREETRRWCFTDSLYPEATAEPRYVDEVALSRRHRYRFRLYLVRAHKPRIGRPPRRGPTRSGETMYRRLHRAPWLLATSLPHDPSSARRITQLYARRMQIEETFRDLKCHRWGFGLRYARCKSAKRLEILLLLGTLATLTAWLVGLAGRALQLNLASPGQHRASTRGPLHLLHRSAAHPFSSRRSAATAHRPCSLHPPKPDRSTSVRMNFVGITSSHRVGRGRDRKSSARKLGSGRLRS
jgi:hypothetical protein